MSLQKLLNPRSIAIVGASDKIGPGFNAWNALQHVGFDGKVYLVNPTKAELLGQKCYPSLEAIEGDVDAAFVAVKAENVMEVAKQAAAKRGGWYGHPVFRLRRCRIQSNIYSPRAERLSATLPRALVGSPPRPLNAIVRPHPNE